MRDPLRFALDRPLQWLGDVVVDLSSDLFPWLLCKHPPIAV